MIQSIEVLDVSDDDGFTRVTAKVSVRIEDFKNYIKQTVLAEKKVRKGLLSKIKIKKKQSKNLSELVIDKVLKDITSTQVIIPVIDGEIEEVTSIKTIEFMDRRVPEDGYVVYIPVKATLNPSFLENAVRILDETADQKLEGSEVTGSKALDRDYLYSIMLGDFLSYNGDGPGYGKRLRYDRLRAFTADGDQHGINSKVNNAVGARLLIKNPEELLTYTFPERSSSKLCKTTKLGNGAYGKFHVPDIMMSFLSETGKVLRKERIKYKSNNLGRTTQTSAFSYILGIDNSLAASIAPPPSTSVLTTSIEKDRDGANCMVFIDTESKYKILTKLTEEVLSNTDKIVLSYLPSSTKINKENPF